ncbi:MAG TPA: metalloregulator ArsR/SmtB family transcription factor [Alphaproteobacteria bacterium]|jgi:ArsR family transcriptional regulator, virulence genes transcriptional regulator|nr:metalloregulator ArsR/SmtB family transcription factor [Alphaproteobacteria bacterium]
MRPINLKASSKRATTLLKALGNERRLLILCYLSEGEHSVGELEDLVNLSQSALSQHLARLRRDQLVRTRRSAQTIFYSLASHEACSVMETLYRLYVSPIAEVEARPMEAAIAS